MMNKNSKIYIAGHNGLVGSALVRKLKKENYTNLIFRSSKELDLRNQTEVEKFFSEVKPEYVFLAAAKVGGILANINFPADFIYDNLMIESNIIKASHRNDVKKLLFLGSSCIYPKNSEQPIREESLLAGELEPTNKAYALAKISGIVMCQSFNIQYKTNYISVMPTNLYGINDNFDLDTSHVLPALISRIHCAKINNDKEVVILGTGYPIRDFLHVDDAAEACIFLMNNYNSPEIINIGSGNGISIKELSLIIQKVVGYKGILIFDSSKPDGMKIKISDISKIKQIGWIPKISLEEGIKDTYSWFLENEIN